MSLFVQCMLWSYNHKCALDNTFRNGHSVLFLILERKSEVFSAEVAAAVVCWPQGIRLMNIYDSLFSSSDMLNEQLAGELGEFMSAEGAFVTVLDSEGNYWISGGERLSQYLPKDKKLRQTLAKVDDGFDPVIDQTDNCSFVVTQLSTERINCGYLFLVLPGYTAETTLANIGIIELLLGQVEVIARLIEKNNQLHHLRLKQLSKDLPGKSPVPC